MQGKHTLEALNERFEQLMLRRSISTVSEDHRRRIADKFANKSLQELHEIARQLNETPVP